MEIDGPMFAAPSPGGIDKCKLYGEYTERMLLLNIFWDKINTLRNKIQFRLTKSPKKNAVSSKGFSYLSYNLLLPKTSLIDNELFQ